MQQIQNCMAWQFIQNTGTHLFLTGKAGTGKTTFLKNSEGTFPKRMVVLVPTGIAAINAGGVTIHSFFNCHFHRLSRTLHLESETDNIVSVKKRLISSEAWICSSSMKSVWYVPIY